MKIYNTPNYNQSFQAKFTNTDSLRQVVEYAVENGKFDKLNAARKKIESSHSTTRIQMELFYDGEYPAIKYSSFVPRCGLMGAANGPEDYELKSIVSHTSTTKGNILSFALKHLIRMGNSAPNNKTFKQVVVEKQTPRELQYAIDTLP